MLKAVPKQIPLMVYGVPFHNVTFDEAVDWVVSRVRSGRPGNIVTANLDFLMHAWTDPELQRILIDADLVLADGFPIVKLAPFFGPPLKGRVTGSDITPMLAERAAAEGLSIYGLGAADGVAEQALRILKERNPELKIAGTYSPPYSPLLEMDHRDILHRLEQARPDILFVALGAPKQDKFISMHVRGWNVPVAIGVGGSLDFITGQQKRAPKWMQRVHLEWFWRMCFDPARLFSRYLANIQFLFSASSQMWQIHRMRDRPVDCDAPAGPEFEALQSAGLAYEPFQPLDSEEQARLFIERLVAAAQEQNLLLDVHAVPWLNSLELGALLEINKYCRAHGRRLILYAPRPKVRRLLETCRLTDYFNTAVRLAEVKAILEHIQAGAGKGTSVDGGVLVFDLPLELTAATLATVQRQAEWIEQELKGKTNLKTLEVNAEHLDFIDSSGLGFLISLKKTTQDAGVSMSIQSLAKKPRRIFEIARVDKALLHA